MLPSHPRDLILRKSDSPRPKRVYNYWDHCLHVIERRERRERWARIARLAKELIGWIIFRVMQAILIIFCFTAVSLYCHLLWKEAIAFLNK